MQKLCKKNSKNSKPKLEERKKKQRADEDEFEDDSKIRVIALAEVNNLGKVSKPGEPRKRDRVGVGRCVVTHSGPRIKLCFVTIRRKTAA